MTTALKTTLAAAAAVAALTLPTLAGAAVPGETQLRGTITAQPGKYDLHVQERNGNVDDVRLHPGTIINPTGLTLRPGMRVTILGNLQGETFAANEIDTPYHVAYVEPVEPAYWGGGFGWGGPFWGGRFGGWW